MKRVATTLRSVARDTRGTELAEAAIVLPLVFIMLIAVFWFGQAFRTYGTITHAAREGARAAVAPACATCSATTPTLNAVNAVTNAISASHLDPAQIRMPVPVPVFCPCGSPSPACKTPVNTCDNSSSTICVQPGIQLSYPNPPNPGGAGTCGTSVSFRYKYPYHLTLPCWPQPCTPLDLQNLSLPAQAQMRLETQ
jgi:TadE-like protein